MPGTIVAAIRIEGDVERGVSTDQSGEDERALVAAITSGRPEALRELLDRHLSGMTTLARRMLRDDAEAEDVAQEAFLRLWRSSGSLEIGPAGVRPWLRRVVSNLCIDRLRAGTRQVVVEEVPEQVEEATQHDSLEAKELGARVDEALKRLPERQRLALILFQYEGLSQNEVAATMGISDEAVESLLARARRSLKVSLKDEWAAMSDGK